jgi:hypothetical protein
VVFFLGCVEVVLEGPTRGILPLKSVIRCPRCTAWSLKPTEWSLRGVRAFLIDGENLTERRRRSACPHRSSWQVRQDGYMHPAVESGTFTVVASVIAAPHPLVYLMSAARQCALPDTRRECVRPTRWVTAILFFNRWSVWPPYRG